ncbi:MAG: DUF3465 domain-containing protein [Methylophilus sp.]
MRRQWLALLSVLLVSCFQAEPEHSDSNQAQSAIEVKSQTKTLDLKSLSGSSNPLNIDNASVKQAFERKQSNVWVEGSGSIKKLLVDDNNGSRHQKFLVSVSDKQTLLFAHNIDLAPRLDTLQVGDTIDFRGEYVYNPKGGVVHWTHRDPQGGIEAGWIKYNGKTYE